jgi:hypothetical protein
MNAGFVPNTPLFKAKNELMDGLPVSVLVIFSLLFL